MQGARRNPLNRKAGHLHPSSQPRFQTRPRNYNEGKGQCHSVLTPFIFRIAIMHKTITLVFDNSSLFAAAGNWARSLHRNLFALRKGGPLRHLRTYPAGKRGVQRILLAFAKKLVFFTRTRPPEP